jgi:hypothetical protein
VKALVPSTINNQQSTIVDHRSSITISPIPEDIMNHKSTYITRRTVLRGLGASIALPWLEILSSKTLAAAQVQRDPGRLACFYIPGCINHYNWFPEDTGFNYTISPSHQPLARHRERFSALSSLSHIEGRIM